MVPWARAIATVGAVAFVVAGCLNVVQGQNVHHYLPGANWAGTFVNAGNLIWLGVVLLLADAVISGLGLHGYVLAVEGLAKLLDDRPTTGSTA